MRKSRDGTSGCTYNARGLGHKLSANVSEHGYKFKVTVELDYAAMTDKQAQAAHKLLYEALDEVLTAAAGMRAINIPLFDLEDVAPQGTNKGVNEL